MLGNYRVASRVVLSSIELVSFSWFPLLHYQHLDCTPVALSDRVKGKVVPVLN
jgi:hypothetical protein